MTLLATYRLSSSQVVDFLTTPDNVTFKNKNNDLFIGKGAHARAVLDLRNGFGRLRDVVVLGTLTLDPHPDYKKPRFDCRHFFQVGEVNIDYNKVDFRCDSQLYTYPNSFRKDLVDIFLDWVEFQRESANAMGHRSILVL